MESRTWSETLFDFFESAFGLASEVGRTVVQRVIAYVKWVLLRAGIGIVASAILGALGAYFDIGLLVFIGIFGIGASSTFAFVALAPAVLLLWVAEEKSEKVQRLAVTAFIIMTSFLVMGVYVVAFRAWRNPEFWILIPVAAILLMGSVVRGSFIDPKKITNWAIRVGFIVVGYIVVSMAIEKVPEFYRARITDSAQTMVGLNSDEVTYESVDKFFSSDGKPQAWYIEYKGQRHFFKSPGYDQRRGQARVPITAEVIDQEDAIRAQAKLAVEQKLVDEQKIADEQKAVTDAEAAKLEAKKERELKDQQEADEVARQQQQEREISLAQQQAKDKQQAEDERIARETAEEEQRQLALQPISVASKILGPTDQSKDIVVVKPSAPFTYRGAIVNPDQSFVVLGITDVKETSNKNQYAVALQPQMLISGGQKYDISRQTEPIQFMAQKDNLRSALKIFGKAGLVAGAGAAIGAITGGKKGAVAGAIGGAIVGTVYAVASHGKKFNMTVGDSIPPIVIRPTIP